MKHIASALVFACCLAWLAASIILTGRAGHQMFQWDWLAVLGAAFSFFGATE